MKDYVGLSRKWFDKQAPVYDETNTMMYSAKGKASCADIAALLADVPYDDLLDVGCGTAWLFGLLAEQRPAHYEGLDLSDKMLEVARAKNIPGASYVQGEADHLPYPDESFDVVTCVQSFHHYPYPEAAMAEALRVLRPGGRYILSDTGIGGIGGWIDNNILFKLMNSGDCHTTNAAGIARMMRTAGFEVVDQHKVSGALFVYTVVGVKR